MFRFRTVRNFHLLPSTISPGTLSLSAPVMLSPDASGVPSAAMIDAEVLSGHDAE